MVQAILLPFFGSWLNEDYAAFQPFHNHIYLDGVKPNHAHRTPQPAGHDDDNSDGVVNIPDHDAAGLSSTFILFLDTAVLLPPAADSLSHSLSPAYILTSGITFPPPENPPRNS
jgi:hypothetical protein